MLPAAERVPLAPQLVADQNYFVIHAPRQSGKTTAMTNLARELTASGEYVVALVSVEVGAPFADDPSTAELTILSNWRNATEVQLPEALYPPAWPDASVARERISTALRTWAKAVPRPLVLFIDEIDALANDALISVLRQLRAGYDWRPRGFSSSLALIGLRDVRDYKVASGGSDRLNTASPFNIKTESFSLNNFTAQEVARLYAQHTGDTGQQFTPEAVTLAYELTQGQPWLVDALARQAVMIVVPDPRLPVTAEDIRTAKEILIQRQDTHLDSLAERLREPRVRRVIEPILAGGSLGDLLADDIRFVLDLGLCRLSNGRLVIANPIYKEVLPRILSANSAASIPQISPVWLKANGSLDAEKLLDAFLAFWRQHGQPLLGSVHYHEVAAQLVMMAFLHRGVNGGGPLEREYAIGTRRMDLCLRYGRPEPVTLGMELKVWRDGAEDPLAAGAAQLDIYLDRLGLEHRLAGHL